jgi:transcriptional regulator with XRE-family HTH domain
MGVTYAVKRNSGHSRNVSTVGDRFRLAREEKEMSQSDVSNLLGLSRAAVAQWESNTTSPSLFKVMEASKILNVSPEWLAFGTESKKPIEDESMAKLPEMRFDDTETPALISDVWSFPVDWLRNDLRCSSLTKLAVWRIEGNNMAPTYDEGDRAIIDTAIKRPSPGGIFLHWDGVGPVLNSIVIRPIDGKPRAIVTSVNPGVPTFEADPDDLTIIGRMKGILRAV